MANSVTTRHAVSIAGKVARKSSDPRSKSPIIGAELLLLDGPAEFQSIVAIRKRDLLWEQRKERLNHTVSRGDGLFHFLDLPAGGPYRIQVTVPHLFTRYGEQEFTKTSDDNPIIVLPAPQSPADRVDIQWVEIVLVATGISGKVFMMNAGVQEPVIGAKLSIQDASSESQAPDGTFIIDGLIGARPKARFAIPKAVLKVTKPGFVEKEMEIELESGKIIDKIEIELDKV